MAILSFRVTNYASGIYLYGNNRLTAREGYAGVAEGYYTPVEQYAAGKWSRSIIDAALAKGWINTLEHTETTAYMPAIMFTPAAPLVTANNETNTIVGINSTMEYKIDPATTYTKYTTAPDLAGNKIIQVRVSEVPTVNYCSLDTRVDFTTNLIVPAAPLVGLDDNVNAIAGLQITMEFNIDDTGYVMFTGFNSPNLAGDHTVLVRYAASSAYGTAASLPSMLTFTSNPPPIVTPDAPAVTLDDLNNLVVGINGTMEYSLNGQDYVAYDASAVPDLAGNNIIRIRVAAEGINPTSADVKLISTENPPVPVTPLAPSVTNDDLGDTVSGMTVGMEYNLNAAGYVAYEEVAFSALDLSGDYIMLVRVAAEGINPVSEDTTLTFTLS